MSPAGVASLGLAAVLCVGAAAASPPEEGGVKGWLERKLSTAVDGEVRFGALHLSVTGLEATFEDASMTIPAEGAPPLRVTATSGSLKLAWSGIATAAAGRVHLTELRLTRPRLSATADSVEALSRKPPRAPRAVEVRIDRLVVEDGGLAYDDASETMSVRLDGVSLEAAWDSYRKALVGTLGGRGAFARPPIADPLPFTLGGPVRISQRSLELPSLRVESGGIVVDLDAAVRLAGKTTFSGRAVARGDLSALSPFLAKDFPEIAGTAEATLRIDKAGPLLLVTGDVSARDARFGPLRARSGTARLAVRPGIVEIRGLTASAYGGAVRGDVDVRVGDEIRFRTDLTGEGIDAGAILDLAKIPLPVAARANGTFAVEGDPADPASWSGSATFDAVETAGPAGTLPTRSRGSVVFAGGSATIAGADVRVSAATLHVDVAASLREDRSVKVTLAGRTEDASRTQSGTLRILEAFGVHPPDLLREPLEGRGPLSAKIETGGRASVDVSLDLADGSFSRQRFDRARLDVAVADGEVRIPAIEVVHGEERLAGSARFDAETGAILEATVDARRVAAEAFLARLAPSAEVDGLVDAELRLRREEGALRGGGTVALRDAVVYGEAVDEASGPLEVDGDRWTFPDLRIRGPAIDAEASGSFDAGAGTLDAELRRAAIDAGRVARLGASGVEASGEIDLAGPFGWKDHAPWGTLRTSGSGVHLGASGLAFVQETPQDLDGTLRLDGDGAHVRIGEAGVSRWHLEADVGWGEATPVDATLGLRDGTFLAEWAGATLGVTVTARIRLHGPLARPGELVVEGGIDEASVRFGTRVLRAREAVPLRFAGGKLSVGPAILDGELSRIRAELTYGLEGATLDGTVEGDLDLSAATVLWPDLRVGGVAALDVRVGGTISAPTLDGKIDLHDGRARILGLPQAFESIDASVSLEGDTARLDGLDAVFGGGQVAASGLWRIAGASAGSYEGDARLTRVTLEVPEGFRGVYDGRLRLAGDAARGRVTGHLNLAQGLYDEDFDVASVILASGRQEVAGEAGEIERRIALDVDVVADGNVWMRNNLGKLESRVDLNIGGTAARPEVTGRLELLEGGTIRFRGVTYDVDSGTVDLADRNRFNPIVDFRGRTRVREYEIELHVEGAIDKLRYELTSYPALSQQDIIALLLTGKTLESLQSDASGGAGSGSGDLVASYFAGFLTGRFSRPIEQALGLEQLQITPLLVPGQADPTARVTLAKQLGRRLRFVYAVDLGTTDSQIYQLEWDISRRFRFLAESSGETGEGGDLSYTGRFGGTGAAPREEPAQPRRERGTVAAVSVAGVPEEDAKRLATESGLTPGQPFSRGAMYEGAEAIRRNLVGEGRIEAKVDTVLSAVDAGGSGYRVTYEVDRGPLVDVRIEGSPWRERRRLAKRLDRYWLESLFSIDLYDEAEAALRQDLQSHGRYAADVDHRVEEDGAGGAARKLTYFVDSGPEVRVRSVEYRGAASLPPDRLREVVLTRPDRWFGGGELDPDTLGEDARALRALYRSEGFLDARVEEPVVRLTPDGKSADVAFLVTEGERYTVGTVTFAGDLPFPAPTFLDWSGLEPGKVFSPASLLQAEAGVADGLDRAGYPEAVAEATYAAHDRVADVTVRVEPGGFKRVVAVEVVGNTRTKERIVTRELTLEPGDPLSRDAMLRSQQRLYRLGVFRTVRLDYAAVEDDDPSAQKVRVRVEEAAPITLSVGPGWSSENGARVSLAITHDNVGGYDRSVGLQARYSGEEKRLQLSAREPRLFNREIEGLGAFLWEEIDRFGYTIERRTTAVRLQKKLTPRWTRFLRYNFQRVDLTPGTDPQPLELVQEKVTNTRLGDVGLTFVRDTRDDPFVPARGGYVSAEIRVFAPPFFSDASFAKLFLQGSLTTTFRNRSTYSVAVRVGIQRTWGGTAQVPLSERYFVGGDSTLRGFKRDGASFVLPDALAKEVAAADPSTPEGEALQAFQQVPLGGEALLLINQEWRFPIWRDLRGVVFADVGGVAFSKSDFDLRSIRESAGLGLRYNTPIGPLRFEYGWKLDRIVGRGFPADESPGEFHIAIGSVF